MEKHTDGPSTAKSSIKRKPVLQATHSGHLEQQHVHTPQDALDEQTAVFQAMSLEPPPGLVESSSSQASGSTYSPTYHGTLTESIPSTPTTPLSPSLASPDEPSKAGKFLKTAMQDVRHFAGGLINHPYEATKHYSILRHSHGLVYYSGPYTSLAITIFSDRGIPPDRTLWLQRRGFSGKTGLKVGGLLGARSTWIDITPTSQATPDQLNPSDERAWQRDIEKFLRKPPKEIRSHQVRETDVLRIPSEADDGYLRVVLCTAAGKKVLCGSPIFRLASSSTDSSSVRGASLLTMPVEVGIRVASAMASAAATTALSPVATTAKTYATSQVSRVYQPSAVAQQAFSSAVDRSGVMDRMSDANQQYSTTREASYSALHQDTYDALARPSIVGPDTGPESPFPVRFSGKVIPGTGTSSAQFNLPTANLSGVPDDILFRYHGVYFGWAEVELPKKVAIEKNIPKEWHQAVIYISPDPTSRRSVVQTNTVRVYLMHEFKGETFLTAKLSVMLMGYMREMDQVSPMQTPDVEAQLFDIYKDLAVAAASLARPEWQAEATLNRLKSAASSRSLNERYVDLRQSSQRQIDRIPVYRLGIRTEGAELKDRLIGKGGVWISRQTLTHASTV
ncbi:hypothetical protein B0A52_08604 [Exophiala mesophila]|uniref:Riboflavin kinase n=1 Tax=Exophiala mesophila TaxID=212818 RepID=A0A438MTY2_EXOME|nr:hypothetical protein B0A52_08604 [Exophiala mesophila]